MKTYLIRAYFVLAVVLPILALVVIPPWNAKWHCLHNLMVIDHHINCSGVVAMGREEGTIDSSGNWITNQYVARLPARYLSCPRSGEKYVVALVVGKHPFCPTHGHMIEEYGVVPHKFGPRGTWTDDAMAILLYSAILLPVSALIVVAVRFRRRRNAARRITSAK